MLMAARGRTPGFYIYAIMDGPTVLYVGKGSGRRKHQSAKKHNGTPVILEEFDDEAKAYKSEVSWISELRPQNNRNRGGGGNVARPVKRSKYSARLEAEMKEMMRIGTQRYAAIELCKRLDVSNCEQWGVSKLDLFRLHEVANG